MDDERFDFTALDPWRDPARLREASHAIVEAHRATPRRVPFSALLASLAPRALLTAALATLLLCVLPNWLVQPAQPAPTSPTTAVARLMERGRVPTGLELLQIAEVARDN